MLQAMRSSSAAMARRMRMGAEAGSDSAAASCVSSGRPGSEGCERESECATKDPSGVGKSVIRSARIAIAWGQNRRDHSEFPRKTNPPEVGVAVRLADGLPVLLRDGDGDCRGLRDGAGGARG